MILFRRFKGMIRPGMALAINDSAAIARRKSGWMVEYLRARRDPAKTYKGLARQNHLAGRQISIAALRAGGEG